ncbi:MAG TPA: TIGR02147 family protein [Deltaproteobacteria bacterium]|nr:TIGR02147 family protein [Deltaproteobacteria bacterium]
MFDLCTPPCTPPLPLAPPLGSPYTVSVPTRPQPLDVFAYLDVRTYLRDEYTHRKAQGRGFSYRAFSRRAGLRSPNHLKRVIDGERTLTPEMALRYAEALGLTGNSATYFCDLAAFGRASTLEERNAAYKRLAGYRSYRRAHHLEICHAEYHANWYIPAIRELVLRHDFCEDPAWIAGQLIPAIRPSEAQHALRTLEELGLLKREQGRLVQGEPVVTTGPETRGLHIRNYHRSMMEHAVQSMDLVPAAMRDISSLTFCTGEETLIDIKERIQRFRQELISLVADTVEGDRVVQLNIQLFPLSQAEQEETP